MAWRRPRYPKGDGIATVLPLFPTEDSFRTRLATRLAELKSLGVWMGTSSWKYEGWMGQVYTEQRYSARGRFSQKKFEAECLSEYAEVFPTVCGDFSFYQFPSALYWSRLFGAAPREFRFAVKAPEDITAKVFPAHSRYGARAGKTNPSFLDAELFGRAFAEQLRPFASQVAVVIFEFGAFSRQAMTSLDEFLERLEPFLGSLPAEFRYAVEIRNPEYLEPAYFDCLRTHKVAHTFNAWTRMPDIGAQIRLPGAFTADFTVVRALLRRGRTYEQAVKAFAPYREIRDPNPGAREAIREIIRRVRAHGQEAYIYVNNRLEGNAPGTIEAILEGL